MNRKSSFAQLQQTWKLLINQAMQRGAGMTFLISAILFGALGYLSYSYLTEPGVMENRAFRAKIVKKEEANRQTKDLLGDQTKFYGDFAKLIRYYREAEPLLPQETEVSGVLEQIGEAARRNNVVVRGLNAARDSANSGAANLLKEREVPALVTGDFPAVVRFLYDLSRMQRIILVRDFAVTTNKNGVSASATLVAFHAPPPDELKDKPIPPEVERMIADGAHKTAENHFPEGARK